MTTFYLKDRPAPYTPATLRGAWDDSVSAVTGTLDTNAEGGGAVVQVARVENSATDEWDALLYRGVSGPLAAQTITGTLNVVLGVFQSASMHAHYHLHVYATQGNSDTPRGTLLTDYREAAGVNEWGTLSTTAGRALNAAQSLTPLAVLAGDRLVVEVGYAARNTVVTSFSGRLYYGTLTGEGAVAPDLTAGGNPLNGKGFLTFSATITEVAVTQRQSQLAAEVLSAGTPRGRFSQSGAEVLFARNPPGRQSQLAVEVLRTVAQEVEAAVGGGRVLGSSVIGSARNGIIGSAIVGAVP